MSLALRESDHVLRRRRPVRRRRRGGAFLVITGALLRALVLVGTPVAIVAWVLVSPYFHIEELEVEGGARVSSKSIAAALESLEGEHILRVSLDEVKARVAASPWIDRIELERELPNRLTVVVVERQPVAILETSEGDRAYLDRSGERIAESVPGGGDRYLVVRWEGEGPVPVQTALEAKALLEGVAPEWLAGLESIDLLGGGELRLHGEPPGHPVLVDLATMSVAVPRYLDIVSHRLAERPAVADLRSPDRIVTRPDPDRESPGATRSQSDREG